MRVVLLLSFFFSILSIAKPSGSFIPCGYFTNPELLTSPSSLNSKLKFNSPPRDFPLSFTATVAQVERSPYDAFYLIEGESLVTVTPTGWVDYAGGKDKREAEAIAQELNKKTKSNNYRAELTAPYVPKPGARSKKVGNSVGWVIYEKQVSEEDITEALQKADAEDPGFQHYPRTIGDSTQIFRVIPKTPRKTPPEMLKLSSVELYKSFMNDSPKNKVVRFHAKDIDNITQYSTCDSASAPQIACLKRQEAELAKLNTLKSESIKNIHVNLEVNVNPAAEIDPTARSEAGKVILDQDELRVVPTYTENVSYDFQKDNLEEAMNANCEIVSLEELLKEPQLPSSFHSPTKSKGPHI